jgi:hypothetical protein
MAGLACTLLVPGPTTFAQAQVEKRAEKRGAGHHEPIAIDEIEIQGELLVPRAVYIVAGAEDDSAASASVLDYLNLAPAGDRIGLVLILDSPVSVAAPIPRGARGSQGNSHVE